VGDDHVAHDDVGLVDGEVGLAAVPAAPVRAPEREADVRLDLLEAAGAALLRGLRRPEAPDLGDEALDRLDLSVERD
jgi:hypothetical protein